MQGKISLGNSNEAGFSYKSDDYYAAYGLFWSGITVGLANVACGYVHTIMEIYTVQFHICS